MHKRTQEERIFGRWVVVIDNSDYERFYNEKDAKNYCCSFDSCNGYRFVYLYDRSIGVSGGVDREKLVRAC